MTGITMQRGPRVLALVACVAKGSVGGFPLCRSSYLTVDLRVHTLHICTLQLVHPGKTSRMRQDVKRVG